MHEGTTEGGGVRGGQPVKWINRVDEYWIEREREVVCREEVVRRHQNRGDLEKVLLWAHLWEGSCHEGTGITGVNR